MTPRTFLLAFLLSAATALGQTVELEKMLFPVVANSNPIPGALGSQWLTDVSVLNTGSTPITISGSFSCFSCFTTPKLPPGITYRLLPTSQQFLLVEKGRADDIRATVRIHDLSRDATSAGADVPFARERDFSDRIDLLGIPTDARFRRTLRIYSLDPVATYVAIRQYVEPEQSILSGVQIGPFADTFIGQVTSHLAAPDPRFAWWESHPASSELGDLPFPPAGGTVRLELRPLTPGTKIWAFLSLTNNETQTVTIIAPR